MYMYFIADVGTLRIIIIDMIWNNIKEDVTADESEGLLCIRVLSYPFSSLSIIWLGCQFVYHW